MLLLAPGAENLATPLAVMDLDTGLTFENMQFDF